MYIKKTKISDLLFPPSSFRAISITRNEWYRSIPFQAVAGNVFLPRKATYISPGSDCQKLLTARIKSVSYRKFTFARWLGDILNSLPYYCFLLDSTSCWLFLSFRQLQNLPIPLRSFCKSYFKLPSSFETCMAANFS